MVNNIFLNAALKNFADLSSDELNALTSHIEVCSYDKKVRVTDIGDQENHIHWIANGLVKKYFYSGKDEVITEIAKEGDLISSFASFITEKPSGFIIDTIEPTTIYSLSKVSIEWLCSNYPELQKLYLTIVIEAFIRSENRSMEQRVYPTKQLFKHFMENNFDLFRRVPQKYLASYLNVKPETFSRLKHLLMEKKNLKVLV